MAYCVYSIIEMEFSIVVGACIECMKFDFETDVTICIEREKTTNVIVKYLICDKCKRKIKRLLFNKNGLSLNSKKRSAFT